MATSWRCLLAPWTDRWDQKLLRQCFALRSRKTQFLLGSDVHRHHLIGSDVPDNRPMAVGLNLTQTDLPTTTDQVSCSRHESSMTLLTFLRRFYDLLQCFYNVSTTLLRPFHDVSMTFPQRFYDVPTTIQRCFCDDSTTLLRRFYDGSATDLRRIYDGSTTVLRRFFDGSSTVLRRFFDVSSTFRPHYFHVV